MKSMQLWPNGKCIETRGETASSEFCVRERKPDGKYGRWHRPSKELYRQIVIEERAEAYLDRDVLCCDSSFVDDLLKAGFEGFDYDNVENMYPTPEDWTEETLKEWLDEHGIEYDADDDEDALKDAVRDNAEAAEVYEWWRVDDWLAGQLKKIGEPVLDNDCGYWWGRTCTGQAMIMDGTLQNVAASFDVSEQPK